MQLFLNIIELFAQEFVHGEHVNLILLKHQLHLLVTNDLAPVVRVLEFIGFDVLPYLLDDLRSRKLQRAIQHSLKWSKNLIHTVASPTKSDRGAER